MVAVKEIPAHTCYPRPSATSSSLSRRRISSMTCAQVWFHASCSSWLIGVSSATRATNRLTASDDGTRSLWPCPLALMRTTTASSDSSTQQSAALYLSAVITALLRSPRGAHTHGTHCTTGGVCVCALLDGEIGAHEHLAPEVEDGASAPLSRMNRSVNAPGAPRVPARSRKPGRGSPTDPGSA